MKKIYSTVVLSTMFLGAFAQQLSKPQINLTPNPVNSVNWLSADLSKAAAVTTLMPSTFNSGGCATNTANIAYYSAWGTQANANFTVVSEGYTFGTNKATYNLGPAYAGALGTPTITDVTSLFAQKYNVSGTANVTDIIVYSGLVNGSGMVNAKVYSENTTTKAPDAQMGTTASKSLSSFTGADVFTFTSPIPVTGNFFAVAEAPAMGGTSMDTLAILSTVAGCSSTDSLAWQYHTIMPASAAPALGGNRWNSIVTDFQGDNLDLLIFVVVDITTGVNNSISKGDLTLFAAFPNPASDEMTVNFGLNKASKVEIEIFDVTGKRVNKMDLNTLETGNHAIKINTSNLNAGVYMYSIKADNAKMFSKFTVTK